MGHLSPQARREILDRAALPRIELEEDTESDTKLTGLSFDLSRFKPKPPVSTPKQEKPQNESFLKRKDVVEEVFKYFGGQLPRGRL
jgi:hypothetical protein